MRLLTTKIWRAYPELDGYDDDVCKRYIKRAKRLQNAWKFWIYLSLLRSLFIYSTIKTVVPTDTRSNRSIMSELRILMQP